MSVKTLQTIWDHHVRFLEYLMLLDAEYKETSLRVEDWDFRRMVEKFRDSIISYALGCAVKGVSVEYNPEEYMEKGNPLKDLSLEKVIARFKAEVLDGAGDLALSQIKTNATNALGYVSDYIGGGYENRQKAMELKYFRKDAKLTFRIGMEAYDNTLNHYSLNHLEALGRLIDVLFNKAEPEKSKDHWFKKYYITTGRYGDRGKQDVSAFEKVNNNLKSPVVSFKAFKNGRFDVIFDKPLSALKVAKVILEARREREKELAR